MRRPYDGAIVVSGFSRTGRGPEAIRALFFQVAQRDDLSWHGAAVVLQPPSIGNAKRRDDVTHYPDRVALCAGWSCCMRRLDSHA